VVNVTSTVTGPNGVGATIPVQVVFSEPVFVSGSPSLALSVGAPVPVAYTSGSGSNTLVFKYVVGPGQASLDLDYTSPSALSLNGGAIRDASLNDANVTLPVPGGPGSLGANCNIVIDTTAPTVMNVTSSTADGTYGVGATIPIAIAFSEPVIVTGTPRLSLNLGAVMVPVNYASGSGSPTLVFNYVVGLAEATGDLDYVSTSALNLTGATISDSAGNPALALLPNPGSPGSLGFNKNIAVDGVAPTVVDVTSLVPNGHYGVGQVIPIEVHFSEAVVVTGVPHLTLETGASDAIVAYSGGSGSSMLVFNYTVAAGHSTPDLDYASPAALSVSGATIRDAVGNAAMVALALPGAPGSLGFNKNIVIP
jgi:hypothetical protein